MKTQTFDNLGLSTILLDALEKKGFKTPSEIQSKAIPILLEDKNDIIGQAQTGTGKTAAFGLPILDHLDTDYGHIQALIITPTRELTLQVSNELNELKGKKEVKIVSVYGGAPIEKQIRQLRQYPDIVVGTPGRLMDLMKSKKLNVSEVRYLVLDEADEMLASGFIEDIQWIISKCNPDRRTCLFSATMPEPIRRLANRSMNDPMTISTKKNEQTSALTEQRYIRVRESDKLETLCRLIDVEKDFYGFVFCRTKHNVDSVAQKLIARGYDADAMHGDLSQHQRERVLDKFKRRQVKVLVVTDVASRGLDVKDLSHVVNFALPRDAETYVHRIGRTGRAGKTGIAVSLTAPSEQRLIRNLEKITKGQMIVSDIPTMKMVMDSKQQKVRQDIEASIDSDVAKGYHELASDLLSRHDAKEVVEGVLSLAFDRLFSTSQYSKIKPVSADSHHRDKPSRDGYKKRPFNRKKSFKSHDRRKGRFKDRS